MRRFAILASALLLAACSHNPAATEKLMSEKEYYEAAQKSLKFGNFDNATKYLESLESHYPVGVYTQQAQLELIYARFRHLDYPGTVSAAERFIRMHPQDPQLDYAYYLRGLANFESGQDGMMQFFHQNLAWRDQSGMQSAFSNFRELLQRFPDSAYAPDARQRMVYIRNQMAEGELRAAHYYVRRGTWVAALARARWIIENYPGTPQVAEALAITTYSYQQLHMDDLAAENLTLLRNSFPDHIDSKGRPVVDLGPQNERRSWLNMLTFGLVGSDGMDEAPPAQPR